MKEETEINNFKITKRFFIIYHISGDSGVGGQGIFFEQYDDVKKYIECVEDLGSMNDDRCRASVLYSNVRNDEIMTWEECENKEANKMEREHRDELEVPSHVVMIRNMTKNEAISRCKAIMDEWEKNGWNKPDDVPETKTKQEYRDLLKALSLDVRF